MPDEQQTPVVPMNLKPNVALPQTLTIPAHLARIEQVSRRFVITTHDAQAPQSVIDWMRADRRYTDWFEPVAEVEAVAAVASEPEDDGEPPVDYNTLNMDALRALINERGVVLPEGEGSGKDGTYKKADLVAALEAADKVPDDDTSDGDPPLNIVGSEN